MGARGPIPHSSAALRLRGSWRAKHRGEPARPEGKAEPPAWLSGEARAEWDRLAPELERLGLLTRLDVGGFSILCNALARYRRALAELAASGETYEHGGSQKISPLVPNRFRRRRHGLDLGQGVWLIADGAGSPGD